MKYDCGPIAERFGLEPSALEGVLLQVAEVEAIVAEIVARPGGSLLVFGCGHDSRFWERVNAGGITVFLEHHAEWAAKIAPKLDSSPIYMVTYDTLRSQWHDLLDHPESLMMDLPPAVRERQWDIIFVDGPTGFDDTTPGRMKSIFEAARLVAPGGRVFVHDAERVVEEAYAARYLGDERLAIEVNGHGLLRGYSF